MLKRLLDKVVIITGATSGIGLEIARFSISQGANVVISGRRENQGKKIANQLGERCRFIKCCKCWGSKKMEYEKRILF